MPQSSFLLPSSHFTLRPRLLHFPRSLSPKNSGEKIDSGSPGIGPSQRVVQPYHHGSNVMQTRFLSVGIFRASPLPFFSFCCLLPFSAGFFSFRMANPCRIFPRLITEWRINMYDGSRPRISREKTERGE